MEPAPQPSTLGKVFHGPLDHLLKLEGETEIAVQCSFSGFSGQRPTSCAYGSTADICLHMQAKL